MTILAYASSPAEFHEQAQATVNTTTAQLGPQMVEGTALHASIASAKLLLSAAQSDIWVQFDIRPYDNENGSDGDIVQINSGLQKVFTLRRALRRWSETVNIAAYRFTAASSSSIVGSAIQHPVYTSVTRHLLRIKIHATEGIFRWYINGALVAELLGNTLGVASTVDNIMFATPNTTSGQWATYSRVLVTSGDDHPDRYVLVPLAIGANGAETGFTGDVTDVDGTGTDDGDFLTAASAGLRETFAFGDIPGSYPSHDVAGVIVTARSRKGTSGPTALNALARVGGTTYAPGAMSPAPAEVLSASQRVLTTNPATGVKWTQAEVNAAEFGIEAA